MSHKGHSTSILPDGISRYRQYRFYKFSFHRAYTHRSVADSAADFLRQQGFNARVVSIDKWLRGEHYRWAVYKHRSRGRRKGRKR